MQFTSTIIIALLLAVSTSTVTADRKSYNLRSGRKLQEETELNLRGLENCDSPISIQAGDTCSSLRNTCGGWASLSCVWARQTCTKENSKLIEDDLCNYTWPKGGRKLQEEKELTLRGLMDSSMTDWSVPMQGGAFDAPPGYVASEICSTCAPDGVYNWPSGCPDSHVGTCTSDGNKQQELKTALEDVCKSGGPGPSGTMSMGHAAYFEQECGECVCIICDDQSTGGCKTKTPFLHMRTDNDNFTSSGATSAVSVEFNQKFFEERWSTNGEQLKTWYQYKKVDACDPSLCTE